MPLLACALLNNLIHDCHVNHCLIFVLLCEFLVAAQRTKNEAWKRIERSIIIGAKLISIDS